MIDMKKIKEKKRAKRHGIFYQNPDTGYQGILYGYHSMSILDKEGQEVLHTGSCTIDTLKDLKKAVDDFPSFMKVFDRLTENQPKRESDPEKLKKNQEMLSCLRRKISDQ